MKLFPRGPREVASERVYAALREVLALDRLQAIERAESLIAIAEHFGVPIEPELLGWIHLTFPGKLWSGAEWKRWCEKYTDLQKALAARQAMEQKPDIPDVMPAGFVRLCPSCVEMQLQLSDGGLWICAACGFLVPPESKR